MKNIFISCLVTILLIQGFNLKVSAISSKRSIALAVCDENADSYMPGEFLVTLSDSSHTISAKATSYNFRKVNSRMDSFLHSKVPTNDLVDMKVLYKPDFTHLDTGFSKFSPKRMSKRQLRKENIKAKFAQKMADSILPRTFVLKTKYKSCKAMERFAARLYKDSRVEKIFLNQISVKTSIENGNPNDTGFQDQWSLFERGANVVEAWSQSTGEGVEIGIIDTKFDYGHPDLFANIQKNNLETSNGIDDDDGNSCIDDIFGCDAISVDGNVLATSSSTNHGTHVATIAAGVGDNNKGVIGVAPKSKLVLSSAQDDDGYFYDVDLIYSIEYLISRGVDVINMSLTGYRKGVGLDDYLANNPLVEVIRLAIDSGITVVNAVGNENVPTRGAQFDDFDCGVEGCFAYLAVIPGVIGVAASDESSQKASFSNYGPDVDITAPGVNILSAIFSNSQYSPVLPQYASYEGTSMAAPIISGIVALLKSKYPEITNDQIIYILRQTGTVVNLTNEELAAGVELGPIVNAKAALEEADQFFQGSNIDNLIVKPNALYFNFSGRLYEKWLYNTATSKWNYILPDGSLYEYANKGALSMPASDKLLEKLDPNYYSNLNLFPKVNLTKSQELDLHKLNLIVWSKIHFDWSSNYNEKWLNGKAGGKNNWYYILPNGKVYLYQKGTTRENMLTNDIFVLQLDNSYYLNLNKFKNTSLSTKQAVDFLDKDIAFRLFGNSASLNWSGVHNEKWLAGNNLTSYYILENGNLYKAQSLSGTKAQVVSRMVNGGDILIMNVHDFYSRYYYNLSLFPGININPSN